MSTRFKAGDFVEVLDRDSILSTLDTNGRLHGVPFMPEMLRFCGRKYRVSKVAHKTCDTAFKTGGRSLDDCYHLENLRCDGAAHAGCQAACLLFWKGAWLRKAADEGARVANPSSPGCTLPQLTAAAVQQTPAGAPPRYACQTTSLYNFTRPLPWWDVRQYVRDVSSGNFPFGTVVKFLFLSWVRALLGLGVGYRLARALYERVHRALVGLPAPLGAGKLPPNSPTPTATLNLRPGELVRVKSHDAILATLNRNNKNRGLWFDTEYVRYCGTVQRVSYRVERILDERTGELLEMKNPCIVLEGVHCEACYSTGRLFCPRAITAYWREVWLERASPEA